MSLDDRIRALATRIAADVADLRSSMGSNSGGAPTDLLSGETYEVAANTQVLWHSDITVSGEMLISGELVEI